MNERLIITRITVAGTSQQVTRVLSNIPNLTAGVIQNQLKNLPWMLPLIEDFNVLEDIQAKLEQLGCHVSRRLVEMTPQKKIVSVKDPLELTQKKEPSARERAWAQAQTPIRKSKPIETVIAATSIPKKKSF